MLMKMSPGVGNEMSGSLSFYKRPKNPEGVLAYEPGYESLHSTNWHGINCFVLETKLINLQVERDHETEKFCHGTYTYLGGALNSMLVSRAFDFRPGILFP